VNAERLHAIARTLSEELDQFGTPTTLRQLTSSLRQSAQDPGQPAYQNQAAEARSALSTALVDAPSNDFSPAWRDAIHEMGIDRLLGTGLRDEVEAIFAQNELTPVAAADQLDPLADQLEELHRSLSNITSAFDFLNIGAETLGPGEYEIGFLIPRDEVNEDLAALGREFVQLERILKPFLELSTGSRPDVRVRSISSSEFQVFLDSAPAMALMIATAAERIITVYEKVLNIRLAHQKLKDSEVPDSVLSEVSHVAETKMEADIEAIADEILSANAPSDDGRANELRVELRHSLNAMANRIDRGFNIEVRVGEIPPPDDDADDDTADDHEVRSQADAVRALQDRLTFRNIEGEPFLQLTEPSSDEE
jgi:hypothetical protein